MESNFNLKEYKENNKQNKASLDYNRINTSLKSKSKINSGNYFNNLYINNYTNSRNQNSKINKELNNSKSNYLTAISNTKYNPIKNKNFNNLELSIENSPKLTNNQIEKEGIDYYVQDQTIKNNKQCYYDKFISNSKSLNMNNNNNNTFCNKTLKNCKNNFGSSKFKDDKLTKNYINTDYKNINKDNLYNHNVDNVSNMNRSKTRNDKLTNFSENNIEKEMLKVIKLTLNDSIFTSELKNSTETLINNLKDKLTESINNPIALINTNEIFNYNSFDNSLKTKFISDLNKLHNRNISSIINNINKFEEIFNNNQQSIYGKIEKAHVDVNNILNNYLISIEKKTNSNSIFLRDNKINEEFVLTINNLSKNIKEHFKNSKRNTIDITNYLSSLSDNIDASKKYILDLNFQLNNYLSLYNNGINVKVSGKQSSQYQFNNSISYSIKDKFLNCINKVDKLSDIKSYIDNSVDSMDKYLDNFFNDSKLIFKKLKSLQEINNKDSISNNYSSKYSKDMNLNNTTFATKLNNVDNTTANNYIRPKSITGLPTNNNNNNNNSNYCNTKYELNSKSVSPFKDIKPNNLYNNTKYISYNSNNKGSRNFNNTNNFESESNSKTIFLNKDNKINNNNINITDSLYNNLDNSNTLNKVLKNELQKLTELNLSMKCENTQLKSSIIDLKRELNKINKLCNIKDKHADINNITNDFKIDKLNSINYISTAITKHNSLAIEFEDKLKNIKEYENFLLSKIKLF